MLSSEYGTRQPARLEPEPEQLACPRCDSTDTKFCYYNNYNLSQPRHYCKSCRRYWTRGGSLRNVPVGGNRRSSRTAGHESAPEGPARPGPASDATSASTGGLNLNDSVAQDCDTWRVFSDPAKGSN